MGVGESAMAFNDSGILGVLKVRIRVFVLISILFLLTTIRCTSTILGIFSLIFRQGRFSQAPNS